MNRSIKIMKNTIKDQCNQGVNDIEISSFKN